MDAFKWQNNGAFEAKKGGRAWESGENGTGESEETSTLRYCLVYSSPYFEIDAISGVITLNKSAEEIVAELGQYTTGLGVRVYESRMIDGQSGGVGSVWSDDASINVTISHWTVERNGNATAQAIASDGCSVDMLAKDCGLTVSEFKNWLTISTAEKDYVELFDGSRVAPENLTSSDVLSLSGQFAVPNVMYMAWFGEVGGIGKAYMNWSSNVQELKSLGFKVEVFNNDDFSMDDSDANNARQSFLSNLRSFSLNKRLHGLYMMGHGGEEELDSNNPEIIVPATIGSLGSNSISFGPQWAVPYVDSCSVQNPIGAPDAATRPLTSISSALNYHLGALIIHACYGDNSGARKLVTSEAENGIFVGWEGVYNPLTDDRQPIAKYWGWKHLLTLELPGGDVTYKYRIGGKQTTQYFEVSHSFEIRDTLNETNQLND